MYPERKPIYEAYKAIVQKVINETHFKSYAEATIDDIDRSIHETLKEIKQIILLNKEGRRNSKIRYASRNLG